MTAQELKTGEPSLEWVDDFYIIVDAVDRKWKCNPPKIPVGSPRIFMNDALLSEDTQVRVKLDEPRGDCLIPQRGDTTSSTMPEAEEDRPAMTN